CTEYANAVYSVTTSQISNQTKKWDKCAINDLVSFIANGIEAFPDEFPHMSDQGVPKVVRLGELDLKATSEDNPHKDFAVAQVLPHPDYVDSANYNDLGLVRLNRDVAFTPSIRPLCLQVDKDFGRSSAIASGWGYTDWTIRETSDHLNKVIMPIQEKELCQKAYKTLSTTLRLSNGIDAESMICAGALKQRNGTCNPGGGGCCGGGRGWEKRKMRTGKKERHGVGRGLARKSGEGRSGTQSAGSSLRPELPSRPVHPLQPWGLARSSACYWPWPSPPPPPQPKKLLGTCRPIADCPAAHHALRLGARPAICFYDGFTPVVCCPGAAPGASPPAPAPAAGAFERRRHQESTELLTHIIPIYFHTLNGFAECSKYGEAVFRHEISPLASHPVKLDQCALNRLSFIPQHEIAQANEFPHVALLGYGDEKAPSWECGGSLISERFVLTSANCISSEKGIPKIVRLGERDLNTTDEINEHEDYKVAEAILHPEFENGVLYNDIALLRLAKDVAFTASIRPACLHTQKDIQAQRTIISGWGPGDWTIHEISTQLRKANMPIRATEDCKKAFRNLATTNRLANGIEEDTMVCAGTERGKQDGCKGDAGGPLQVPLSSPYCMYSVVGVYSFGKGTCVAPFVYTRVSHFVPWIESVVWPNEK
ncbi:Serine protease snake, partial [Gryllus bimaculatus]